MKKYLSSIILRYLILILLSLGNLFIFYEILGPLTFYPVYFILDFVYGASILSKETIYFNGISANIVPACIAGSAYYLLLILNLTTKMKVQTRIKSIGLLIGSFLILNIVRIVFFAALFSFGFRYFDLTHRITWYAGSTILVVLLWFGNVYLFRIKEIPIYSDIKTILRNIKS